MIISTVSTTGRRRAARRGRVAADDPDAVEIAGVLADRAVGVRPPCGSDDDRIDDINHDKVHRSPRRSEAVDSARRLTATLTVACRRR
jgi:hypothetical protein